MKKILFDREQIKKLAALIILISLFGAFEAHAQNPNLGTSGAQFLQIPVGAKGASLGSAYISNNNDASAVFWNPAGIAGITGNAAHFSHLRWFGMFSMNAASLVYNAGDAGVFAAGVVVFSMDQMEITTETKPNGTGQFFDAQDLAFGISYARNLTDQFAAGITAKYISQRIWNETADGIAFDIGTQYRLDFNNLVIAMSMSNFGPDLKLDGEDLYVTHDVNSSIPLNRLTPASLNTDQYPLPLVFQVGIGMDLFRYEFIKMRMELNAVHPNDNYERINSGAEISFFDRFFLRGGYKYNYDQEKFTFGAGANLPLGSTLLSFDYAYSVYEVLPDIQRVSVGINF